MKYNKFVLVASRFDTEVQSTGEVDDFAQSFEEQFPELKEHTVETLTTYNRQGIVDTILYSSLNNIFYKTEYHEFDEGEVKGYNQPKFSSLEEMYQDLKNSTYYQKMFVFPYNWEEIKNQTK